jgi:Uma2 family endonuclease
MIRDMPAPARRRATYQDVIDAPEHQVAEIVDGELYVSPRPAAPHAVASSRVGGLMSGPFDFGRGGPGGWWLLDEPELHFGEDVLVPDLAGWRRDRMPVVPPVAYFELAPDWVCEVVSPKTGRLDRMRKLPVYARERVAHAWLIDPLQRTIEVFRLDGGRWVLLNVVGDDQVARLEPFDAIEIDLLDVWGESRAAK